VKPDSDAKDARAGTKESRIKKESRNGSSVPERSGEAPAGGVLGPASSTTDSGGVGALPIILAALVLAAVAFALIRRRYGAGADPV
jgi:hypothetical protein